MDKIERLERLSKLLDDGKISADEYETLKQQVLEESAPTSEQSDTPPPAQSPPQQEAPERQMTPGYWAALVLGVGIASALLAWALLGGTNVEWSSDDLTAVVGYCQDTDASTRCGGLAEALRINGCTVSEAYNYVDSEAFAVANPVPPAGAGPIARARHTQRGGAGVSIYCEIRTQVRDLG